VVADSPVGAGDGNDVYSSAGRSVIRGAQTHALDNQCSDDGIVMIEPEARLEITSRRQPPGNTKRGTLPEWTEDAH
jgi:hypothetical protein